MSVSHASENFQNFQKLPFQIQGDIFSKMTCDSKRKLCQTSTNMRKFCHTNDEKEKVTFRAFNEMYDACIPQEEKNRRLKLACEKNNLQEVRRWIALGADPNYSYAQRRVFVRYEWHVPILVLSADLGHTEVVNALLQANCDVNASGTLQNDTALIRACKKGYEEIVRMLLAADGIMVNAANYEGQTPLMHAVGVALSNRFEKEEEYWHLLHDGHVGVLQLLLERGAHVNLVDRFGNTALNIAARIGHVDMVRMLLDQTTLMVDLSDVAIFQTTALMFACERGYVEIVRMLLDHGANVNLQQEMDETYYDQRDVHYSGFTPLHFASVEGHVEVVQMLLDSGANRNVRDKDGRTPLYHAEQRVDPDMELMGSYNYSDIVELLSQPQ